MSLVGLECASTWQSPILRDLIILMGTTNFSPQALYLLGTINFLLKWFSLIIWSGVSSSFASSVNWISRSRCQAISKLSLWNGGNRCVIPCIITWVTCFFVRVPQSWRRHCLLPIMHVGLLENLQWRYGPCYAAIWLSRALLSLSDYVTAYSYCSVLVCDIASLSHGMSISWFICVLSYSYVLVSIELLIFGTKLSIKIHNTWFSCVYTVLDLLNSMYLGTFCILSFLISKRRMPLPLLLVP